MNASTRFCNTLLMELMPHSRPRWMSTRRGKRFDAARKLVLPSKHMLSSAGQQTTDPSSPGHIPYTPSPP